MSHLCPNKHASQTADFCSVCGAEIVSQPAPPPLPPAAAGEPCPHCGTPREMARQVYCEACGCDLRGGTPAIDLELVQPKPAAVPVAAACAAPLNVRWDVVVRVDGNLYGKPNPDAPGDQPPQTFTLFEKENMLGRDGTGLRLQVPVRDPGVSKRQLLLVRETDGTLVLRDLNSANGTQVNGTEVVPGADVPLRDGDSIAVGAWTRIAVRAVVS